MTNELIIKTYDVDYSFIISNYLDKELWGKEWTLFVYKDFVFRLSLNNIDTKRDAIQFEITLTDKNYMSSNYFTYFRKQSNFEILKKQINGTIFELIKWRESNYIRQEDGYKTISEGEDTEREILEQIANEFLDDNGVTNREIRDVYIDNYVSNNTKTSTYLSNYVTGREYCLLSDLYLVYTKITDDENRYNLVLAKIKNSDRYMEILEEANTYINKLQNEEEQEEIIEEFKECLEAI